MLVWKERQEGLHAWSRNPLQSTESHGKADCPTTAHGAEGRADLHVLTMEEHKVLDGCDLKEAIAHRDSTGSDPGLGLQPMEQKAWDNCILCTIHK